MLCTDTLRNDCGCVCEHMNVTAEMCVCICETNTKFVSVQFDNNLSLFSSQIPIAAVAIVNDTCSCYEHTSAAVLLLIGYHALSLFYSSIQHIFRGVFFSSFHFTTTHIMVSGRRAIISFR